MFLPSLQGVTKKQSHRVVTACRISLIVTCKNVKLVKVLKILYTTYRLKLLEYYHLVNGMRGDEHILCIKACCVCVLQYVCVTSCTKIDPIDEMLGFNAGASII